jgi:hypothetical protein
MVQFLIVIIIIIIATLFTYIAGPFACVCLVAQNMNVSGGKEYTQPAMEEIKDDEKARGKILKMVLPSSMTDATLADVLKAEERGIKTKSAFAMTLQNSDSRLPYRRRPFDVKPSVHWGQLKLFLSELQFLSEHGHFSNTIVYAGAAPGTHIKYLSEMFPTHKFILWDPRAFDVKGPMIETHEEYFTDEVAKQYAGQDVLFVSDIRTGSSQDAPDAFEGRVGIDMEWQMNWHKIMKPAMGMYKFRLPYAKGKTTYMDGTLQLQVFAPTSTTELRLIVPQGMRTREYCNERIEEQMYYFNYFTRPQWFDQTYRDFYLDGCWDCTAFISIIRKYLSCRKQFKSPSTSVEKKIIIQHVKKIIGCCSRINKLNAAPHGDGSRVGWYKRWRNYDNMLPQQSLKRGFGITEGMQDLHKKMLKEIKSKYPKLLIPPVIDYNSALAQQNKKNGNTRASSKKRNTKYFKA